MGELLSVLLDPDIPFLRSALLAGILSSVLFGVVGSFVTVRKIGYIAGSISHASLAGVGFALYCQYNFGWVWFNPVHGALFVAIIAGTIIGLRPSRRFGEDSVIGAIWAVGMALGLLFMRGAPPFVDPMDYLFGNILLVTPGSLVAILVADLVIAGSLLLFFRKFQAACFDPEFSSVRGLKPEFYNMALLLMISVTVVITINIIGIVLVIALLTLPAAVGRLVTRRLVTMMIVSSLLAGVFVVAGIGISYITNLPSGPVIIVLAGLIYILVDIVVRLRSSVPTGG